MYAAVCCACAVASCLHTKMICQVQIHSSVCCACAAAPGSLASYFALLYAAVCCARAAALDKTFTCFTLQYTAMLALMTLTAL